MEFDKRERVNHSCVGEEGRRWKSATLGRTEEGRRGNEPSLQTGDLIIDQHLIFTQDFSQGNEGRAPADVGFPLLAGSGGGGVVGRWGDGTKGNVAPGGGDLGH